METKQIKIDSLVTENLQTRAEMHDDCIKDYAETYRTEPGKMPPVTVFYDVTLDKYYLADGFHRVAACKLNGSDTVLANVSEGTYKNALRFAVGANASNKSIYRSNADKHHALEIAWANWPMLLGDEKPKGKTDNKPNGLPSSEQLAALCCVNPETARVFMQKKLEPIIGSKRSNKSENDIVVPEICEDAPDALKVTREHLEERDADVRALLKKQKDRFGVDIPDRLLAAFLSREPQSLVRGLNLLYGALEKRRMEGEMVFAPFVAYAMTHLDNLVSTIKHGMVYCVCRMCRGRGCGSCNNIGFQTKPQYDRNPSEFKAEKL